MLKSRDNVTKLRQKIPNSILKARRMTPLGLTNEQRNMVMVLLCGAVLVVLNQTLLSPALPSIMQHLQVDATTVQWLTSAYALVEAVVIPLAAWFMGRFSTRVLFIGAMALFGAGSLVAAIAPVFAVLLVGRIMQAMATGVMMVMVMSLILLTFPRESRGKAMGLVSLVIGFAPAIGPTLGGLLVDVVGWRALFCIVVVFSVLIILFAARSLKNREGFPRTSADALSIIFSSIGLAALLYGLSSFASSDHVEVCVALMVIGLIFVGLFVRRQFKIEEPMLRLEVLYSRRYRMAFIVCALFQAILIGLSVIMPLYIQNILGYSATISGLATLPGALLGAVAGLVGGKIFDQHGVRGVALGGVAALFIGCIGLFFYAIDSSMVLVIAANMVTCGSLQILFTPINTWGVNSLNNELVQHATATTNTVNQVGASLGTALIMSFSALGTSMAPAGTDLERTFFGYHWSFAAVLALGAIALLLVVLFIRNMKSDVVPATKGQTTAKMQSGAKPQSEATAQEQKEGEIDVYQTVGEVMDTNPVVVPFDAPMSTAAKILAAANASGAVIVDDKGTARGFISNSDILRFFGDESRVITGMSGFVVLRELDNDDVRKQIARMKDIQVSDVATKKVIGVSPDTNLGEACKLLAEKRLKLLPVVEGDKLVGVVHRSSLLRLIADVLEEDE